MRKFTIPPHTEPLENLSFRQKDFFFHGEAFLMEAESVRMKVGRVCMEAETFSMDQERLLIEPHTFGMEPEREHRDQEKLPPSRDELKPLRSGLPESERKVLSVVECGRVSSGACSRTS